MTKVYLLIDDEAGGAAPADLYGLELQAHSGNALTVSSYRPTSLQSVIDHLASVRPDGVFLDVALTNATSEEGLRLPFDGITLAQQIRVLQTRRRSQGTVGLTEFPLIRMSKRDVIREYVSGDTTSDDLFDEMLDKDEILEEPANAARRAVSLASDYPRVVDFMGGERTNFDLANLLGCTETFLSRLEARVLLGLRRSEAPAHVLARSLTASLLARPGPLIAESLLSIRLGVDPARSGDWSRLLERLGPAFYGGAFASGYPRWWMQLVLDWWSESVDAGRAPFKMTSEERVRALRAATGLAAIEHFAEDPDSPGAKFWHLCTRSDRPVDPAFGYALMPIWGQESWQDVEYLCLEEARRDRRNPRLGPLELARLARGSSTGAAHR